MNRLLFLAASVFVLGCERKSPQPVSKPLPAPDTAKAQVAVISVTTASESARAAFERGRILVDNLRFAEAVGELRKAIETDPKFALAHAYLAFLAANGPEREALAARAEALLGPLPEAERLLAQVLLSRARGADGKTKEARVQLLAKAPDDWRAHNEMGEQYYGEEKFEDAVAAQQRAVQLGPQSSAWNGLGYALAALGRTDEAIAALERYVAVTPGDPNPYDSLGEVALFAGRYQQAEAAFAKASELNPALWGAQMGVAQARFLNQDYARGYDAIEKAAPIAPGPLERSKFLLMMAWAQLAQGDGKRALETLDELERDAKAKALSEQRAAIPIARSAMLTELGRPAAAIAELGLVLEKLPDLGLPTPLEQSLRRRALVRKVIAEAALEKGAEAERTLAALVQEGKRSAKSELKSALRLARGMAAWAKGDKEQARTELSQCALGSSAVAYTFDAQPEVAHCLWRYSLVLEELGDAIGAQRVRATLLKTYQRDPVYLYLHAKALRRNAATSK